MPAEPPYSGLTPDTVLAPLASVGFAGEGRLLALNSYENRVYQVWLEDGSCASTPPSVVAKFYRPARWSDAQVLEEHAFSLELAEREIPVVAPLTANGNTLHASGGFRFAIFPRRGGRTPELEDRKTLQWIGRFIGRIHPVGATRPFAHRPALGLTHYSAWIARRWDDPAFPAAFPWFNTQRYWQDRILELKEQIALMQEEPIRV